MQNPGLRLGKRRDGRAGAWPSSRAQGRRPEATSLGGSGTTCPTMPPPRVPPRCREGDGVRAGGPGDCGETHPDARTRRAANWAHFCQKKALAAALWLPRRHRAGRYPSTARTGPTLLSFGTRSHNRREWEPAGPSPPPDRRAARPIAARDAAWRPISAPVGRGAAHFPAAARLNGPGRRRGGRPRPALTPGWTRAPPRSRSRCSARGRSPPPTAAEASPVAASLLSHRRPPS